MTAIVGTWATTANSVIGAAIKDIGEGETPAGSNINAITKEYGDPGDPWCAMAIWAWFHRNGVDLRQKMTAEFASTVAVANAAKHLGIWHEGDAGIQRGDLLLMHFPGGDPGYVNHIGIVTQAANIITTIEGNISNAVRQQARVRGGSNPALVGYVRPPYMPATFHPSPPPVPAFPGRDAFVMGKSNPAVVVLGNALVRHGYGKHYRVGPSPDFTEADRLNTQDFQHAQGWRGDAKGGDSDGYPGPETWARLMR